MISELNIEDFCVLEHYLRDRHLIGATEPAAFRALAGGISSRAILVAPKGSPAFVVKQSLRKLRVKSDWFSSPGRIHREALGMRWLNKLAPPGTVPELLYEDSSAHLIVMSAVQEPNRTWKELLFTEPPNRVHFRQFAKILSRIHQASHANRSLEKLFENRSFFESLRLEPYYRYSGLQVPESSVFLNALIEDTLRQRISLVHGDYSPKNILVHSEKFVLVDHEVIHYGDPAFDLGFALTHLLAKSLHLRLFREQMIEGANEFVRDYLDGIRGVDDAIEARACRHTAACLLARVVGRSPLEYLTAPEKSWEKAAALRLMRDTPVDLATLIASYKEELACRE